jgi:hypothetical protein
MKTLHDFFFNSPPEEVIEVIKQAAQMANEEQKRLVDLASKKE